MPNNMRGAHVCLLAGLVAVAALFVAGCGQQPVAIVNGQKITRQEFIDRLKQVAGKQVLTDLIQRKLLEDAIAQAGITVSEKEVQEQLDEIRRRFPSPEAFQEALAARGYKSVDEYKKDIEFGLKLEKLLTKDVKYTEADLKKFFERNRELFDKPERVVFSQIVVSSKEEADKIYKELQKPGANFAALARLHSIDAMTREHGGRFPEMPIDNVMPPEVRAALRKMKVGEISKPIQVLGNWYIVKLEDRKPAEKAVFEKVKREVERAYKARLAKNPGDLLRELVNKAVVQVLDPDLADVQKQFMPKGKLPSFGGTAPARPGEQGKGAKGGKAKASQPAGAAKQKPTGKSAGSATGVGGR